MPIDDKTLYIDDSDLMNIDPLPYSDKPRSKLTIFYLLNYFSYYCPKNNS